MADIVLTTLNAKYSHPAFGLRYLLANLQRAADRAVLLEFDIKQNLDQIAHRIASQHPRIVGLAVYIWNASLVPSLMERIKALLPHAVLVLGGPEISYDSQTHPAARLADHIVCGEGDLAFAHLADQILSAEHRLAGQIHVAPPPDLQSVRLPYDLYTDRDLAQRLTYVETSRGCVFACDYCISAVGPPLRYFALDRVLPSFEKLLSRGARVLKFVDRTFNLNIERAVMILNHLLKHMRAGQVLHLEMAPDRFPAPLREIIARFPPGALDLEIGVQTFNPEVAARIHRHQDMSVVEENLRFLRERTRAILHVDLIAGLPGETWDSIRAGFDRLVALRPHRIQLGILKKLRGAPIAIHDQAWDMNYDRNPPYAIRSSVTLSREQVERIARMAKFWERIANRETFSRTMERLRTSVNSPWDFFMSFSDWFYEKYRRDHGIALRDLTQALFEFATDCARIPRDKLAADLAADYSASGKRRDVPSTIRQQT